MTFTTAAALRLAEQGKIDIDGPVTQCLDDSLSAVLAADGYKPDVITMRQALTHTAGLFDYAQGEGSGYVDAVLADPTHRWTPLEQVQWAADHGDPLGPPGAAFSYSEHGVRAGRLGDRVRERPSDGAGVSRAPRLRSDWDSARPTSSHSSRRRRPPVPGPTSSSRTSTRTRSIRRWTCMARVGWYRAQLTSPTSVGLCFAARCSTTRPPSTRCSRSRTSRLLARAWASSARTSTARRAGRTRASGAPRCSRAPTSM